MHLGAVAAGPIFKPGVSWSAGPVELSDFSAQSFGLSCGSKDRNNGPEAPAGSVTVFTEHTSEQFGLIWTCSSKSKLTC